MKKLKYNDYIAVLDIGTSKIVCLVAKLNEKGVPVIIAHGHQLAKGIGDNGVISDIKSLENSIISAISKAEKSADISIEDIFVNFSGNKLKSRFETIDIDVSASEITDRDVLRINELAFEKFSDENYRVIQCIPVTYTIDGISGINNPRFMYGKKLTAHLNLVTLSASALRNLLNCLSRCHLNVSGVVPSAYASALSCISYEERQNGVTILDIGEGNISVGIFVGGKMNYTISFPFAGKLLTCDIQQVFSLNKSTSERLKSLYGSVFYEEVNSRDTIDLFDIIQAPDMNSNAYIQKHKLCEVIYCRTKEILNYINDFLSSNELANRSYKKAFNNIVLTGGSANLIGVAEVAKHIFGVNVKVMKPTDFLDMPKEHNDPKFSTAYGLILYAIDKHKITSNKLVNDNVMVRSIKKITGYNNIYDLLRRYF